jgi:hypothetical protein
MKCEPAVLYMAFNKKGTMKKLIVMILLVMAGLGSPMKVSAQSQEIAQLLLNLEKLVQLKQILEDLKKGYVIVKTGYTTIKDLSEGNFNLHKTFLDGLLEVSPAVKDYRKVAGIVEYQLFLVREYKGAYERFIQSGTFTPDEIAYLARVYDHLLKASLRNLDELAMVITSGDLRMSDDERLEAIDRIYAEMEDKVTFLRHFNSEAALLALRRGFGQDDIRQLRDIYGLE